jgi:hypothetical protein
MKRVFCLIAFVLLTGGIKAQISQSIKSKINTEFRTKLNDVKYKGNITLTDYKEIDSKSFIVIGQFDWEADYMIGGKTMEKRKFKARIKVIFDDIEVIKLTWEKVSFWPGSGWVKECIGIVGGDFRADDTMCSFDYL